MSTKVKSGDSINIPEGCKAVIEDGKVIFSRNLKMQTMSPKEEILLFAHIMYLIPIIKKL